MHTTHHSLDDAHIATNIQTTSRALAFAGLLAALVGLIAHQMWRVLPWERLALSLLLAAIAALLALPLGRLPRGSMATGLLLVWLAALIYFAGASAVVVTALLGAAALAIGSRLIGPSATAAPLALALGLVIIGGPSGWLLSLPIHRSWVWLILLLIPIVLFRHALRAVIDELRTGWQSAVSAAPHAAAWTVMLLGLVSTGLWFPTLQADDVAYHLGLPNQLLDQARYQPLPEFQIWSYAPWLGDTLHGIASVLAGGDARGGVNLLWLTVAAAAFGGLNRHLRPDAVFGWSATAVFASFPPLVWLTAGMQTELPAIALMLCLLHTLLAPTVRRRGWIALALFAGLVALKPVHGIATLPLLIWGGWRYRADFDWRVLIGAPLLIFAIAGSSYLQSWLVTGNPVLPLLNSLFQAPYLSTTDIADPRWHAGFDASLPWLLTFDSTRYVEGWNGALGFSLIALAGASLLTLRDRSLRGPVLAVALGMALTLLPMQYARYAFPPMILLAALSLPALRDSLGRRSYAVVIVALCVVNLAFQSNASWLHHSAALKRLIRNGGESSELFVHYLPERELIRRHDDGIAIWLTTDPARHGIAELGDRARTLSTHAPLLLAQRELAEQDASGQRWRLLIEGLRPRWLLIDSSNASPALSSSLIKLHAERIDGIGDAELWRLPTQGDQ